MKKIKISPIVLIALVAALLAGCRDFLDLKPKGRDVAQSLEHFNGLLNTTSCTNLAYNVMTESGTIINSSPYWVYMSDEWITDQNIVGNMSQAEQNAFKWEADIFSSDDYPLEFGGLYQQIYTYNVVVDGVMDAIDGTQEEKRQILAEARVARAYNYMLLAQFFSKPYNEATAAEDLCVPLVLEPSTGVTSYSRATVRQIYDFFITELEQACPEVGEYTLNRMRIFRASAYAILGRAYMFVYDYDKAAQAFAEAERFLAGSSVPLELFDYKATMPTWKQNPMWENGMGYPMNYSSENKEIVMLKQVMPTIGGMFSSPKVFIKPGYMDLFADGDLRREFYTTSDGAYSNHRKQHRFIHNEGVDLPAFHLMYAECLARTGDQTNARRLVNTLREHRFEAGSDWEIPATVTTQDDLVRFVVEERQRELMGTGNRWFDMRRLWNDPLFQDLKAGYTHFDGAQTYTLSESRLVMRIPPSVMIHNSGWTNNE